MLIKHTKSFFLNFLIWSVPIALPRRGAENFNSVISVFLYKPKNIDADKKKEEELKRFEEQEELKARSRQNANKLLQAESGFSLSQNMITTSTILGVRSPNFTGI